MRTLSRSLVAALAAGFLAAAGCGGGAAKAKVTGAVSFNGKPVEDGYIVFRPADGKGADAGGPIVSGNYTLSAVPVGPKTVVISSASSPATDRPLTSEEASKMSYDPKKKGGEIITPDAKGNNAKVEVKEGEENIFDFALKTP